MTIHPILLSGKQGSGKSTTTERLAHELRQKGYFVYLYKFATPLYEMHDAVLPILKSYDLVPQDMKKLGRLLQLLGTEFGREYLGSDVWVNCAKTYLKKCSTLPGDNGVLLIDDCRFKNELAAFQDTGFTVRLEADRDIRKSRCDSWRDTEDHISETDLDGSLNKFSLTCRTDVPGLDLDDVADVILASFDEWLEWTEAGRPGAWAI